MKRHLHFLNSCPFLRDFVLFFGRKYFFSNVFAVEVAQQLTGTGGAVTGTGGAVCKGATPSVEQPGGRGFKPRLRSLLN